MGGRTKPMLNESSQLYYHTANLEVAGLWGGLNHSVCLKTHKADEFWEPFTDEIKSEFNRLNVSSFYVEKSTLKERLIDSMNRTK